MAHRRLPEEQATARREAISHGTDLGLSITQIAAQIDISAVTLRAWMRSNMPDHIRPQGARIDARERERRHSIVTSARA